MARHRTRKPDSPAAVIDARFEGSAYSNAECKFLIKHFGESSIVAFSQYEGDDEDEDDTGSLPDGVNPKAVGPILDRTHQLEQYQEAKGSEVWCGFDKLKAILEETIIWRGKVQELKRMTRGRSGAVRAAAGAPSLFMWDPTTDLPSLGGVGADAERTLTALDEKGRRKELYTDLQQTGLGSLKTLTGISEFLKGNKPADDSKVSVSTGNVGNRILDDTPDALEVTAGDIFGSISCPICQKTESFEVNKPESKKAALKKITDHLGKERVMKVDQHRLLAKRLKSGRVAKHRIPAGASPEAEGAGA